MPNFNIHWKGYPHRRLPRIRVASTSGTTVRSRSIPRIVTADSIQLERERKKQRFAFRRRQARQSRSSSSAARARKHASLRARQHIQVFGWDANIASKASTIKTKSVASAIRAPQQPPTPTAPEDTFSQTTVIDSNDGAAASACRFKNSNQPEKLYSLMHVAEVPVYWSTNKPSSRRKPFISSSRALMRASKSVGEYAHVKPLDPVSRRRSSRPPRRVGKSRTYDARIDPRILLDPERPTKSFPTNPTATTRSTASRPVPNKSWQGNPNLRRILSSKVSKAKANPQSVTPSMKSIVQSLLSDPASRTPSQRKALKRFTKELELYLQAAKSLPKHSLVPSSSATTLSAHTIEELRPYQSQLRSAGLAVTAADQLRATSIMAKLRKAPSPPPTPPKDGRYTSRKSKVDPNDRQGAQAHHHNKIGSIGSFDTGTTIMDFTPPHEQTTPRNPRGRQRSSLSSDHTIMAFTPPHEKPPPQPEYAPPPPPRASTKKSLPWLRKQEPFEASPTPSPQDKGNITASTVKTTTRNPSDVLLFIEARDSAVKKNDDRPKERMSREAGHRTNEVRWDDKKSRSGMSIANIEDKPAFYNDAAIQAAPELSDGYALADQAAHYANATTQTNFIGDGPPTPTKQDDTERRAPLIQNKSKTFPTSPTKCAGDCSHPVPRIPGVQSPRKRYKDQAMQTEVVERLSNAKQVKTPESKRSSFKTSAQTPNRTFQFASPSPFQRSPVARSPHKSVDDLAVRSNTAQDEPQDTKMAALQPPSPLRCTQCSAKIQLSPSEPQMEPPTESGLASQTDLEPEYEPNHEAEIRLPPPPRWSHTCTARSSLECQQCASVEVPAPVSQQGGSPNSSHHSPPGASRQSPLRTTHWAATLEAELEEIIQGYHCPEERFMQRKVIQDTMEAYTKQPPLADPVKRPSPPRLRLRPRPTSHATPKQERVTPAAPLFLDTIIRESDATSSTLTRDSSGISDRAVFRGLHVATAAACDEDVAKWIEEITGTGIRRFLADLSAFDGLGFNTLAGVARRAAKQRRGEVMVWERVREKRLQEKDVDDGWEDCAVGDEKGVCIDRKMGLVAGDETVNMRADKERSGEEVLDDMIAAREHRSRECLRERAVRMGWRGTSISGVE